jgi:molybdenum cofactor biosynthesis enzyme MoaA
MKFYSTFKRLIGIKNPRVKLAMLACGRIFGMRYVGMFIDPVIACNLRCRMCYFSDPNNRPKPQGVMTQEYIASLRSVMKRAIKMQIGCGAEPTLYQHLPTLIKAGKEAGIPYIEITTNGQLLTQQLLSDCISAGLNGITLSLHGTTASTYEYLMDGGKFSRFKEVIEILRTIKQQYPKFQLRINYTINNLNKDELSNIWELFSGVHIDVLQVRPIQKLGDTAYNDFVIDDYDDFITRIIQPIAAECQRHSTIGLLPSRENVEKVNKHTSMLTSIIEDVSYCYVSPTSCYRSDFDPNVETIAEYQHRSGISRKLHRAIFRRALLDETQDVTSTKKLNYN